MGSRPLPFPLFPIPGSREYEKNKDKLKQKNIINLHGQLWPLIESSRVDEYRRLARFLLMPSIIRAKDNLDLLSQKNRNIFLEELKYNNKFIDLCLKRETPLLEIENELKKKDQNILYISASPKKKKNSRSKKAGDIFLEEMKNNYLDLNIDKIELSDEDLEFIDLGFINFLYDNNNKNNKLAVLSEKYISLFRKADKIVISTPMWGRSIPSNLKCFFELISSRLVFKKEDPFRKKSICCILSRKGNYSKKDSASINDEEINFQELSLYSFADSVGLGKDIEFIYLEGKSSVGDRKEKIQELAKTF